VYGDEGESNGVLILAFCCTGPYVPYQFSGCGLVLTVGVGWLLGRTVLTIKYYGIVIFVRGTGSSNLALVVASHLFVPRTINSIGSC
jgi:hypothetical protein